MHGPAPRAGPLLRRPPSRTEVHRQLSPCPSPLLIGPKDKIRAAPPHDDVSTKHRRTLRTGLHVAILRVEVRVTLRTCRALVGVVTRATAWRRCAALARNVERLAPVADWAAENTVAFASVGSAGDWRHHPALNDLFEPRSPATCESPRTSKREV